MYAYLRLCEIPVMQTTGNPTLIHSISYQQFLVQVNHEVMQHIEHLTDKYKLFIRSISFLVHSSVERVEHVILSHLCINSLNSKNDLFIRVT
jgi:hypothetical protein